MDISKLIKQAVVGVIVIFFLMLGVILIFIEPITLTTMLDAGIKMLGGVCIYFALAGLRALVQHVEAPLVTDSDARCIVIKDKHYKEAKERLKDLGY